ncbi:MAG: DNA polymerase III subunit gamma/tau [Spirochaetia bacterium]
MPYEVTATKKRPSNFDELVGQEFVVSTLKNSVSKGRIAHAFLFSGPRGVGKTSAARVLAKALNCVNGPTPEPCGECAQCREITKGRSLDVIEIDGASNTGVNDVREIKEEVLFAPNSSRYKIYIIDEVHMLSNSAFNALLKTIEEPPPYIVFIFATTELHKVPATIKSRCQQFNFRLIHLNTLVEKLTDAAADLGISAQEEALYWIAKEATGSMRDAYTLFDQVVSFSQDVITLEKIQEKLGLVGLDDLNSLVESIVQEAPQDMLRKTEEILRTGVSVEQFIVDITEYFRSILFITQGIQDQAVIGYDPKRFSAAVVENFTVFQIEKALELLFFLYRNLRYTVNERFELELVLSKLTELRSYIEPANLLAQIRDLKQELLSAPRPAGSASEAPTAGEPVSADEVIINENVKREIVNEIKKSKLALASALEKALAWNTSGTSIRLDFDSNFHASFVNQEIQYLTEVITRHTGKPVEVSVEIQDKKSEKAEQKDEQVQMVKQIFRGEIIQ